MRMRIFAMVMAAAFAFIAIGAQAVQASEEPQFTGAPTGFATYNDESQAFHAFGGEIRCQHGAFEVERLGEADTVTVEAAYADCTAFGVPATLDMNSCDYRFNVDGTDPGESEFLGTTDIDCVVEGDVISVAVFGSQAAHENDNPICHVFFPEQEGLEGLRLDNSGEHVDVTGGASGITATQIRTSFVCPSGTHETSGEMTIEEALTVEGENHEEEAKPLAIEGPGEAEPPQFTGAPTAFATYNDASQTFHSFGGEISCQHGAFDAERLMDASSLTVQAAYSGCEAFGLPMTIDMNGCDYVVHVDSEDLGEHEYRGSTDVVCPEEGAITIAIYSSQSAHEADDPICRVFVGVQEGLEGLRYDNDSGHVDLTGSLGGIEATQERNSIFCPPGTETTEAEFTFEEPLTVEGENHLGESEVIGIS